IVKDSYKGKEVSYYVEKEYAPVARRIFGKTPEMIALFSKLTGVDYPWVKYAQITGRDYVSGAMENTTATLHSDVAQQDARELTDYNRWEEVIAHELFHQWFGDYVTAESWSNLTLNESFATLGSQLWNEFHYGKDAAMEERYNSAQGYLHSGSEKKDLVRFLYNDKEDMFDAVSYNKGGAVLQMLRHYVGDSAFFKSLNLYLTTNKFKSAEAQQLRLAFEEVTGKDLNPFFNQWYFGSGHPKLNINYSYNNGAKKAMVIVEQTQADKVFSMPVAIEVWNGSTPTRHNVWVKNKIDTFLFDAPSAPALVNFDADKVLLADRTENKTLEAYAFQYKHASNYVDRREAIEAAAKKQAEVGGVQIMMEALKDKYAPLRAYAANSLDMNLTQVKNAVEPILYEMAQKEGDRRARAAAISKLGQYRFAKYTPLFKAALNDSSYSVAGSALEALNKVDTTAAFGEAQRLAAGNLKGKLASAAKNIVTSKDKGAALKMLSDFEALPLGQPKFQALGGVFELAAATSDLDLLKRGIDDILALGAAIPEGFREQAMGQIYAGLKEISAEKKASGLTDHAAYIDSKLPKEDKKGM
ncbi:MAG TPA: M1 family aminopeptidase, partial [Flavisolibacter sp.]|nr:M1 family aminopeptidase [Flavisolibacter sp.]